MPFGSGLPGPGAGHCRKVARCSTSSSSGSSPPPLPYTEDELSLLRDGIPVRSETYFKPDGREELKEVPKEEPEATVAPEPEATA